MTEVSKTVSRACLFWKTEKPFRDITRKSYEFAFLGAKWWLEATHAIANSDMHYRITLKKKTDTVSERNNINITTILNYNGYSMHHSIRSNAYKLPVQTRSEFILWDSSQNSLSSAFSSYGVWEIICIFHDILSAGLMIENIKVDSSTQVDTSLTTTAEKSIQVSQNFSDMEELSLDFSSLLIQPLYPDAKFRCGDRIMPVHRSILAARSSVFKTIFQDQNSDTFDVTDLDDKTLDLFLEYVYSGTILDLSDSAALSLYGAGKKYSMDSLRKACSDWMIAHMTEQNCVSFLQATNATDDNPLVEAVASYLCDHPDVFKSQSWDKFAAQQMALAYKLLHRSYCNLTSPVKSLD